MKKVLIRTVDTDVVAISIGLFRQLDLLELWLAVGTGNHLRYIEIHKITAAVGPEKSKCLSLFHAFIKCDQVLLFAVRGKKTAWITWNHFGLFFQYVITAKIRRYNQSLRINRKICGTVIRSQQYNING